MSMIIYRNSTEIVVSKFLVQHSLHLASDSSTSLDFRLDVRLDMATTRSSGVLLQNDPRVFLVRERHPDWRPSKLECVGIMRTRERKPVSNKFLGKGVFFG